MRKAFHTHPLQQIFVCGKYAYYVVLGQSGHHHQRRAVGGVCHTSATFFTPLPPQTQREAVGSHSRSENLMMKVGSTGAHQIK